jgi:hypothetical protein
MTSILKLLITSESFPGYFSKSERRNKTGNECLPTYRDRHSGSVHEQQYEPWSLHEMQTV